MGLRFALVGSLSYSVKPRGQRGTPENVFGVGERQGWPHHSVKIAQLRRFAILASQFSGHDRARKYHHDIVHLIPIRIGEAKRIAPKDGQDGRWFHS